MKVTIVPLGTLVTIGALGPITKGLLKGLDDLEVSRRVETIQTNSNAENGQNTETSPGDLRRLVVTQTPLKDHQLTLMWKTLKEKNNNIVVVVVVVIKMKVVVVESQKIILYYQSVISDYHC